VTVSPVAFAYSLSSYDAGVVWGSRLAALLCGAGVLTAGCSGSEAEPPPEGTIVFADTVGKADKYDDLYAVHARTGARRNLTQTARRGEMLPSASPDGMRIAFYGSAPQDLQVLDLRANTRRRLATGADLAFDVPRAPPAWSPDGGRIAFGVTTGCDAFEECERAEVWIVSAEGGRPARISRDGRVASWSPDGRQLAWWGGIKLEGYGSRAIVWDVGTGRRRDFGRSERPPVWLPDGSLLAGGWVRDLASGRSRRARPIDYGLRSPDGSHVALIGGPSDEQLHVARIRGGGSFRVGEVLAQAWSPGGRRLAYIERGPPRRRVSVINADGSGRRELWRDHLEFETSSPLVWAANNLLVYSGHLRGQDTELLAVAPDGEQREQLTRSDVSELEPAVSPKGGWIAFVRGAGIWSMRRGDSKALRVTGSIERRAFSPAWSPEGDEIAFARSAWDGVDGSPPDVFVVRRDGSSARRLTRGAWATDPAWSPDGERIAYTRSQRDCRAIWLIAPDGEEDERLTDCDFYAAAPAWSPDGEKLAFLARPRAELDFGRFLHLYVVDADGGDPRLVAREVQTLQPSGVPSDEPSYQAPSWSPDGRRLVFSRRRVFDNLGVYVVDATGGQPVRIDPDGRDPSWAPLSP
jgi:Tol biopolymer transport system component